MIYGEKILKSIASNYFDTGIIKDNDVLVLALSGGMDSMCLADAFCKLQGEVNYKLMAIHIHHGIRGAEADRDMAFVKKYCKDFGINLKVSKVNVKEHAKKNKLSLEESARLLRYDEIDKYWKKLSLKYVKNNVYVIIAHHEKDQVETIIHNLLRGSGIKGLIGMQETSGNVLRPLINISKTDIEKYVDKYDIPYVNDSTNDDTAYTRNFIRKEILPKLESVNVNAISHIAELGKQIREISEYIENEGKLVFSDILISKDKNKVVIDLKKFKSKNAVIKTSIIKEVFNTLVNTLKDITRINISDIIDLTNKEKGGHLDLPYNLTVDKKQNNLIFIKNKKNVSMSRRKKR